ncbi:MAG: HDOD domain-containing protein [Chitinispirillaceae bacterium]|nr:HDOD domain-containing protein [Chitinispirillaceae bacterium]
MKPVVENQLPANAGDRYRRVIENIDSLPSLPAIVTKLLEVVNSPETSADDATRLIEKDPALTSKFIRLANSAFYGMPRAVSSVSSAVVILGFNVIRSVVLSASVMKMFSDRQQQSIDKDLFWKHSIATALAAKEVVRHLMGFKLFDPESMFCAGILHDIGKLIFDEFVHQDYKATCESAKNAGISLIEAESRTLGINHAEIGRILADKWALPLDLENVIVHHHEPEQAGELTEPVTIVHIANVIAHEIGADMWEREARSAFWRPGLELLRIDETAFERIKESSANVMSNSVDFLTIIR